MFHNKWHAVAQTFILFTLFILPTLVLHVSGVSECNETICTILYEALTWLPYRSNALHKRCIFCPNIPHFSKMCKRPLF